MSAVLEEVEYVSIERAIPMRRVWAMPCKQTFNIPPIRALVRGYLSQSKVSVDPFARNKNWATYTNDLNPETSAAYHLKASDFLTKLVEDGIQADLVLFDPPYSRRQVIESYQGAGLAFAQQDSQYHSLNWPAERGLITRLLAPNGIVISFGWHSNGMNECGSNAGKYAIEEILLVAHSGAHHDTIVTVERKIDSGQRGLFEVKP
jgi:hypothetical protein